MPGDAQSDDKVEIYADGSAVGSGNPLPVANVAGGAAGLTDAELRATPVKVDDDASQTLLQSILTAIADGTLRGTVTITDGSGPVTVDGTVTADTELPAAAALSDALANPTTPQIAADGLLWDATNSQWVRARAVPATAAGAQSNVGVAPRALYLYRTTSDFRVMRTADAATDTQDGANLAAMALWMWNGSSWDRITGSAASGLTVNTELPAAAALSDAVSNPTTSVVGSMLHGMSSSTAWTRLVTAGNLGDANNGSSMLPFLEMVATATFTYEKRRTPKKFKPQSAVAIATEATVWTPAGGTKFRLMGGVITSSVAGNITFKDNTSGTTIAVVPALAGDPVAFDMGNGILSAAANNVLTATGPALATLSGTLWGTEE